MALTKQYKNDLIADYTGTLASAPHAFVVGYQGVNVPQVTDLREKVRQTGGSYVVVKNSLALRALDGKALGELKSEFTGMTAVAYTYGDPVALAKTLTQFAKDVPAIQFKGGVVDRRPIAGDQVKDIASLPSREELIAKLLYLLQSPITRLVRTLAALPREFVVVLDQIRQKKEGVA